MSYHKTPLSNNQMYLFNTFTKLLQKTNKMLKELSCYPAQV